MIVKTFRDVICDNKSLINSWKKDIKFMLTTDNYDEYDGDGYRKYLDGIYSQMNTHEVLFVQATPNDCDYDIEVFWSNKNDNEQFFEPFETLTLDQARMVFEQVSDNKGTARNRQISLIEDMFDNGYDVPYNFCIDSIKGNITQRVTESTSQIGEVGLYCSKLLTLRSSRRRWIVLMRECIFLYSFQIRLNHVRRVIFHWIK